MIEFIPKTDESSKKQLAGIGSFTERKKYPAIHVDPRGGITHWYVPDDDGKIVWFTMERVQTLLTYYWPEAEQVTAPWMGKKVNKGGRPKKEPAPEQEQATD